ncbi:phage tail tape measure protein [Aquibium sp. ELW1220]|uniref:phage tail tape measure protein n=1 Tax=Aquibium sp. ELW1220 TaxID=2976766 RepID=UPI0025AF5699|nr:phage tail tape measure protein [Aquibium sp. ELW1220]MDN2581642.1 phage tail tape measure protein [Aquibium sp. ELW1220]
MAQEIQKLVIALEARTASFEKALKRATGATNRQAKAIETRFEAANKKVAGIFKNFGAGLVGGIAAGGIAGIVTRFAEVARSVATIGDEAKRAGVSVEAFQELKFVAEQNRIGLDSMIDGLKELSLRSDEFIQTGAGPAAEAIQRLGYSAEELQRKLKDPSELLLEIIGRLGAFDKAAQIRLGDELFGGSGGERLVELIAQGEDGLRATIDRAHELGTVMDAELIDKAAELDRRFNEVVTTIGTALKTAIVEAATALEDFINAFSGALADLDKRRQAVSLGEQFGSLAGTTGGGSFPRTTTTAKTDRLPRAAFVPPVAPAGGFGAIKAGGGAKRDASASAAMREAEAVRELIAELEAELALVGATDLQREIANTLRQAGAAATAEQQAQIVALVTALEAEATATRNATAAAEELRGIGRDVLGGMISDLRSGASAAEVLQNALSKVADRLIDIALNSIFDGGGFNILSIFGLKDGGGVQRLAGGGPVRGPGGPRGDKIPAMLSDGEFVTNARATSKHRGLLEAINADRLGSFQAPAIPAQSGGGTMRHVVEVSGVFVDDGGVVKGIATQQSRTAVTQGLAGYDKAKQRQQLTNG